jgi:hypothetical protein
MWFQVLGCEQQESWAEPTPASTRKIYTLCTTALTHDSSMAIHPLSNIPRGLPPAIVVCTQQMLGCCLPYPGAVPH